MESKKKLNTLYIYRSIYTDYYDFYNFLLIYMYTYQKNV
jgi:hypothetical protein